MGQDFFEISINIAKMLGIFLLMVQMVPILVWVERRGSAFIQNRFGPNRVGPLGLTQLLADAVKFLFKEEFVPPNSHKWLYYAAPVIALIPGAIAFSSIPLSHPIFVQTDSGPYTFPFQGFEMGIGIVFVLAVSSLGTYALLLAGWGSNNKYSLFGALRASAQMISYELAMGLSLVGILMLFESFNFADMIEIQKGPMHFSLFGKEVLFPLLPNWGIFYQPLGFLLFATSAFAETNRLPFDLPEAEGELVAGFHTEYGGLKMLMFYIGEYGHMMVASALMATFYFGGYELPYIFGIDLSALVSDAIKGAFSPNAASIISAFVFFGVLMGKILFFLWVFIWVRWTLPRFRYDQLMDLGWKTMLPWALANVLITAFFVLMAGV
ncbi:MAG: NADH-quinone oxidoreductase subunit H [Bdellovibrionaceae bacterium]|nr:NADH-quinone oxidoreductase subunit H [Pseudobdellovibrionaceae bacterium]